MSENPIPWRVLGCVLLPLLLAVPLWTHAAPTSPTPSSFDVGTVPDELVAIARQVRDLPLGERMDHISRPMLGKPYLIDAVGEGVAPDLDPPARYDFYDCLTFVEEVMSLAMPADPRSAPRIRRQLRYTGGESDYTTRRHFMLQQWIPENLASGWLKDITAEFGETHLIEKEVTAQTWSSWRHRRRFELPDESLPTGRFTLAVLSLDAAVEIVDQIPVGAIILTVREDKPYIPIVVSHVGFKVASDDVARMRHATKLGSDRVRDERLAWYLDHIRWYDWWQVEGITILMPQELGPRRTELGVDAL
ncbi:MAG: hypothetical protein ACI8S6_004312 [Myxococcota bacterium]|jgi:hypothetical protein